MKNGPKTIYFATGNKGKFEDLLDQCVSRDLPFALEQLVCDVDEIQSDDQVEIAMRKARAAWEQERKPLLVDDAGMFFEQYHNFPGTFSKYIYRSLKLEGLQKLFAPGDKAYFAVVFAFADEQGEVTPFQAKLSGSLIYAQPEEIDPALPFTAMFVPEGATKSYQQLARDGEKGPFAVRAHALDKFLVWFKQRYGTEE